MLVTPGLQINEVPKMLDCIFTSLRAIMPQIVINGDINVNFNGDGWIVVVLLTILVVIVLCGKAQAEPLSAARILFASPLFLFGVLPTNTPYRAHDRCNLEQTLFKLPAVYSGYPRR